MNVVIVGPTGVGKTKLSVCLAKYLNSEVINADATQIYKELNIGSAKVTNKEMDGVVHHLIDIRSPKDDYSVMEYQRDLRSILDNNKDKNYIIVGGTGLYICAGLFDYRFLEDDNKEDLSKYSNQDLYDMASNLGYVNMDINNRVRLERMIHRGCNEVIEPKLLYKDTIFIGLTTDRNILYERINKRVDEMFDMGLVEEVKGLLCKYPESNILKRAIGYKEVIEYINGKLSIEEAKELIKKNSRHYAKRQYTWFNNKMDINWFNTDFDNFDNTVKCVIDYINSCHIS